jgi:hypothetical protein
MKRILPFLILIFFCSCEQQNKPSDTISSFIDTVDASKGPRKNRTQIAENNEPELANLEWRKYEDSLRNEILKSKKNNILKESFLQELYIRNVITVLEDSLLIIIPFDIHSNDCGAPDCYKTDVSFSFKLGNTLRFPEKLQFQEHEHGCVDKETKISGIFQLIELNDKHVIYHSIKYNRTLVLFRNNKESGAYAYYCTGVEQNRITGRNVYKIINDFIEEDSTSIFPYTSWVLSTAEYENFLH